MTNIIEQLSIQDELRLAERKKATSVWYNRTLSPERDPNSGIIVRPETMYVDASASKTPVWTDPVFDYAKYQKNYKLYKEGNTNDTGKFTEDPFIDDWKNIAQEYNSKFLEGATVTNSEFSAVDVVNVFVRMLGTELRDFVLHTAPTIVSTPQLELNVDTFTRFTASSEIGEGIEAPTKRGEVSRASFDLTKDVGHIAITDEAQMKAVHDLYRTHIENAQSDLIRLKAAKVAAEMATATDVNFGDWSAYTTDHSTVNPFADIGGVTDTILQNNGRANSIAMSDKGWRTLQGNTHFKGLIEPSNMGSELSVAKTGTLPSVNLAYYVDNEHAAEDVTIFEKDAIFLMQGPVNARQYRLEASGIDGYITRDWNICKIVQSTRIRNGTSILTP